MDEFDYLPEYGWPAEEAPYGRYTDSGTTSPTGRHRGPGEPDYAAPPPRTNGVPQRLLTDGRRPPGRPARVPRNSGGYPAASGPMQAYQQPNGRPAPGYPPPGGPTPPYPPPYSDPSRTYRPGNSGPMPQAYRPDGGGPTRAYRPGGSGPMPQAYRPDGSGPMQAYRPGGSGPMQAYLPEMQGYETQGYPPDMSGPMAAYRPNASGPMQAYQQPNGRPVAGYPRAGNGLVSEFPVDESTRAYQQSAEFPVNEPIRTYQPPADRRTPQHSSGNGKEILGWLPFGNRLVLLPKDRMDDDEELREHRDTSDGWLRPAVFGAMDGLVTNVSLIAGVGAGSGMGSGARSMIVLTGIAGLIAGAFSMATGEFISVSSQNELNLAEVDLERKQHARDPEGKLRRLAHLFVEKGVSPNLAEAVVRQISADPERAVEAHLREELGIDPDDLPSPRTAAIASLASFTVGALIPLAPFLLGTSNLMVALVLSGSAAFIGGAAVAKLTGRPVLLGGLRQLFAAALGAGAAFGIGHVIGTSVS